MNLKVILHGPVHHNTSDLKIIQFFFLHDINVYNVDPFNYYQYNTISNMTITNKDRKTLIIQCNISNYTILGITF